MHLRGILIRSELMVTAIVDPNKDARAALMESLPRDSLVAQYNTIEQLFDAADVEIMSLCIPHDLHEPLAVYALQRDVFVVLEKPLAPTISMPAHPVGGRSSRQGFFMAEISQ